MVKVRSRPIVKEALKWTGVNVDEMNAFVGDAAYYADYGLHIKTLEGDHFANVGDWIVKGIKGEFYPVKPDIFVKTYEMWDGRE